MTREFHHTLSPLLQTISAQAIVKVNERLKLGIWGIYIPLKDLFVDDKQINQTLTKLLQNLVNYCIKEVMEEMGNPFLEESNDLLRLDTKDIIDPTVVGRRGTV